MSPEDPRHGVRRAGYDAHRRDGEEPCQPCRDAAARYQRGLEWDLLNGRRRKVPATGTLRRLRALVALGWTIPQIAEQMGAHRNNINKKLVAMPPAYVRASTAARAARLYDEWSMRVPEPSSYATRARQLAAREGWVPPLAWDDIDNDPAPASGEWERREDSIDHAVVERMLGGAERPDRKLTSAECAEITRRATARGMSQGQIEDLYGIKADRYVTKQDTAA